MFFAKNENSLQMNSHQNAQSKDTSGYCDLTSMLTLMKKQLHEKFIRVNEKGAFGSLIVDEMKIMLLDLLR